MCGTCGCTVTDANAHLLEGKDGQPDRQTVTVLRGLLAANDQEAEHNRAHFDRAGVLAVNLMSSPGAGKTSLLERTIEAIGTELRIGVIEGDLATENDAARIRARGVPAVQITTGSACHLDAHMIHNALHDLPIGELDVVFIENVGNLVCPASFDLGQHRNVTLLSVTEGDDKPAKYPVMFRAADLALLTKTDLLAVLDDFSTEPARPHIRELGSDVPVVELAARRGIGIDVWLDWVRCELDAHRARIQRGESARPAVQPDGLVFHAVT